jgi:hypothetical protein
VYQEESSSSAANIAHNSSSLQTLQRLSALPASRWRGLFFDQIFHSVLSSIRRGDGLFTPGKAEKVNVLSAVATIFSTS